MAVIRKAAMPAHLGKTLQRQNRQLRQLVKEADELLALYLPGTSQRTDKYLAMHERVMGVPSAIYWGPPNV